MPAERLLTIAEIRAVTPSVREFVLEGSDRAPPFEFAAGQFVMLLFERDGVELARSYSFASAPNGSGRFAIAVAPVEDGPGTSYLWSLEVGDEVRMKGPLGRFVLRPNERPDRLVLVGTGTGIAPYRAMLPTIAEAGLHAEIVLGVRTRADALYANDFRAFARETGGKFHLCLSREAPREFDERSGYVISCINALGVTPGADLVYLCGNPNMVDDGIAALRARGFEPRQFRREKYV